MPMSLADFVGWALLLAAEEDMVTACIWPVTAVSVFLVGPPKSRRRGGVGLAIGFLACDGLLPETVRR